MAASLRALDEGALQQAWKLHKPSLTDKERKYFESFACDGLDAYLDKLVSACKTHRDAHLRTKIADWFEPVLQAVQQLMPMAQLAMSVHPMPGNLILGGIVGIMQLAERLYEYQTKSMQMLSRMSAKMQVLLKYEKHLYEDNDFVITAITAVFGDILKFCSKVFQFIEHREETHARIIGFRWMLFKDFEKQLGETVREFDENMEKVEARALECDKERLKQTRAIVELQANKQDRAKDNQDEHNRQLRELSHHISAQTSDLSQKLDRRQRAELMEKILLWLSPLRPEDRYTAIAESHLEGTGTWLLTSPVYQNWKTSGSTPILWIRGKPGCGKSYLAAKVILDLDLILDNQVALAYMFCERADSVKQTRRAILGALAKQVMLHQGKMNSALNKEYSKAQRPDIPAERLIWDVLKESVAGTSTTYLIIDALDECRDGEDLVKDLIRLTRDNAAIRVIVFSRDDTPLEDHLNRYPQLRPDYGENEVDLRAYLDSVLDDPEDRIKLSEEDRQQCVLKADGVILWVQAFRQGLRNRFQRSKRLREIGAMQPGLDSRYDVILSELGQGCQDNRDQAWLIFLLVTHAKSPLTALEMMELILDDPPEVVSDLKTLHDAHWPNESYLVGLCSNLIFIRDGYVRLSHESVRDHLEDTTHSRAGASWREEYRDFSQDSHGKFAKLCLEYLLLKDFGRGGVRTKKRLKKWQKDAPFLRYAATTWSWHYSRAIEQGQLIPLITRFVNSSPRRELCLQVRFQDRFPTKLSTCIGNTQPLTILAMDGLKTLTQELLSLHDCVEQFLLGWNFFDVHVLEPTAGLGHEDMIAFLLHLRKQIAVLNLGKDRKSKAVDDFQNALPSVLHVTVTCGHASIARLLIEAGADVEGTISNKVPCLVLAASKDDLSMVQTLLDRGANPHAQDNNELTALHLAASRGHVEIGRKLLLAGANPAVTPAVGTWRTPLRLAARGGHVPFIKLLKEHQPDLDLDAASREDGTTPLHDTSWYDRHGAAAALLTLGCKKDIKDKSGSTALYLAAQKGHVNTVKVMVMHGCDIMARHNDEQTPLHAAAWSGKPDLLQCLLAATPQDEWSELLSSTSKSGRSILHCAIEGGNRDCIKFVLHTTGNASAKDHDAATSLHYAAFFGVTYAIRPLLSISRDSNPIDKYGQNPLHHAASQGHAKFIEEFIQACKELDLALGMNTLSTNGSTPLMSALNCGHPEVARLLLQNGAASIRDKRGCYPIHLAVENGYQEVIELLVSQPGIDCLDDRGGTVLHCAAYSGKTSMLQSLYPQLVEQLNVQDKDGSTPIMTALEEGHMDAASFLLDQQPNLAATDKLGQSIVHLAAAAGDLDFLRRVLERYCVPLRLDVHGWTPLLSAIYAHSMTTFDELMTRYPESWLVIDKIGQNCLHAATVEGNIDVVGRLETLGANIIQKNLFGETLMQIAIRNGQLELVVYLHLRGCSLTEPDHLGNLPLAIAAEYGYAKIVRYILANIDQKDVDRVAELTGRPAIWRAVSWNYAASYEVLAQAGANTMNIKDYCGVSAEHFREFESIKQFKSVHVGSQRRLHEAVIEHCKQLKHIGQASAADLDWRIFLTTLLTRALRMTGDFDSAIICLMNQRWNPETDPIHKDLVCCFCGVYPSSKEIFLCRDCLRETILCEVCHTRYCENQKQYPPSLIILKRMEDQIEVIRNEIPSSFNLVQTMRAVFWFGSYPYNIILASYVKWQRAYNTKDEYGVSVRPGQEFLRIVTTFSKEKDELLSLTESHEQDQNSKMRSLNEEYERFKQLHPTGKPRLVSSCSGHDFLKISWAERIRIMADNVDLDSKSGRITSKFLDRTIARHEAELARLDRIDEVSVSEIGDLQEMPESNSRSSSLSAFRPPPKSMEGEMIQPPASNTEVDDNEDDTQNEEPYLDQHMPPKPSTVPSQESVSSLADSTKRLQIAVRKTADSEQPEYTQQTSTAVSNIATVPRSNDNDLKPTKEAGEASVNVPQDFSDLRRKARKIVDSYSITDTTESLRKSYLELYKELIPDSELVVWGTAVRMLGRAAPDHYKQYVEERKEMLAEGLEDKDFED